MLFVIIVKTVVGIPAGVFHSMFAMVNMERFELTPESNGRLLSYVGVITMVSSLSDPFCRDVVSLSLSLSLSQQIMQGFGVGFFSKRFTDHVLLKSSIVVMSLSYLLLVSVLPCLSLTHASCSILSFAEFC